MTVLKVRGTNKFEKRSRCLVAFISHLLVDKKMTRYAAVKVDSLFLFDVSIIIDMQYNPDQLTVIALAG